MGLVRASFGAVLEAVWGNLGGFTARRAREMWFWVLGPLLELRVSFSLIKKALQGPILGLLLGLIRPYKAI